MPIADLKLLQDRAESGDIQALLELGKIRMGEEKFGDAAVWIRRAAELGDLEGQLLYGTLLHDGLGVDQDLEAAAYWLRQAAESGNREAQVMLAQSFESGAGVPVNHALAAQWYMKAAIQGDVIAQFRIGELLHAGDGVEKNLAEARSWLTKAALAGCLQAQVALVECLIDIEGVDIREIMKWANSAADRGSPQGAYRLGWAFENGPAGIQSYDSALSWYGYAAELGSNEARLRLGTLYAEGKIVARDPAEAERWLNMLVSEGEPVDSKVIEKNRVAPVAANMSVHEYPPGSVIDDKYFILSMLGRGGMCMVYKAKHLILNRMVALKMLLPESAANQAMVERFNREARAASSLSHPNIVTIYEISKSPDGKPFMIMDYLEGQSLEEQIENLGPIPASQAIRIFMQVCSALDTAHEASIIHRDIKPSNIMLTKTKLQPDVVKVVDFGLAKMLDSDEGGMKLTKTGEVFGTILYMSPEQCLGHPLDVRTDIYSLGCTMYEALTGYPVHRGATAYEVMSKHINSAPPPFEQVSPGLGCPPELEGIVLKTLAKNREDRFQSMSELYESLSSLA